MAGTKHATAYTKAQGLVRKAIAHPDKASALLHPKKTFDTLLQYPRLVGELLSSDAIKDKDKAVFIRQLFSTQPVDNYHAHLARFIQQFPKTAHYFFQSSEKFEYQIKPDIERVIAAVPQLAEALLTDDWILERLDDLSWFRIIEDLCRNQNNIDFIFNHEKTVDKMMSPPET